MPNDDKCIDNSMLKIFRARDLYIMPKDKFHYDKCENKSIVDDLLTMALQNNDISADEWDSLMADYKEIRKKYSFSEEDYHNILEDYYSLIHTFENVLTESFEDTSFKRYLMSAILNGEPLDKDDIENYLMKKAVNESSMNYKMYEFLNL